MRLSLALGASLSLALAAVPLSAQGFAPNRLWVAASGSSNMKIFDANVDLLAGGLPAPDAFGAGTSFSSAGELAFGPDGRLYAAAVGASAIRVFDADGFVESFDTSNFAPVSITAGPDGRLYAGALAGDPVVIFDTDGTVVDRVGSSLANKNAVGIAVGPDGHIYISSFTDSVVYVLDRQGALLDTIDGFGALDEPRGLAIGPSGRLWVADAGRNKVFVFDTDGTTVYSFGAADLSEPFGLAFTWDGLLYVSQRGSGRIATYTDLGHVDTSPPTAPTLLGEFGAGQLSAPLGIALSPYRFPVKLKGPVASLDLGGKTRKDTGVLSIDPSGLRMQLDLVDDPDDETDIASIFGGTSFGFIGYAAPDKDPAKKLYLLGSQAGDLPAQDGSATLQVTLSVKADKITGRLLPKKAAAILLRGSDHGILSAKVKGGKLLP